ncbi:MAG TPA: glycoside hydrolase family 95 protein, partial [Verrucomicrobiae bacterium]
MKLKQWIGLAIAIVGAAEMMAAAEGQVSFIGKADAPDEPLSLWYRQPAKQWIEALPVGNGRIGAMIFGGVEEERLQLNEGTLWAGGPYDPVNPEAKTALPEIRRLIFDGQYKDATELIGQKFMAKPLSQMPYQTVGSLLLTFPGKTNVENYRRDLNLDTATTSISYAADGVHYVRQIFASAPDGVIVVRLTADKSGQISFAARMETPMAATVETAGGDTLIMRGVGGDANGIKGQLKYQARVKIVANGGKVIADAGNISVSNADAVTLFITAATSYRRFDDVSGDAERIVKDQISTASRKSFARLRAAHVADFQKLFRRVSLDLGHSDAMALPTDERLQHFAENNDPQFAALFYQFGRYLLISCSRPGGQPAGLQGLWNNSLHPPWEAKYTININTEMNYWLAESGNLSECAEPLVAMVDDLTITGARTAREQYGARGWVVHHNTDLWRATAPIDGPNTGTWPCGGAWLCLNLWDHYEFSGDKTVLQRIYPMLKGASQFFLDTLQEEPQHKWLVTNPSMSPENFHPFGAMICAGPTMDMQILRDLFTNTVRAAQILGVDENFREHVAATRARLAPNQIGRAGQLQEWQEDWDMQEYDMHHRHVSHLYGLYPGRDISLSSTPGLAAAARKSLELRGDDGTGWSKAWKINLWAH